MLVANHFFLFYFSIEICILYFYENVFWKQWNIIAAYRVVQDRNTFEQKNVASDFASQKKSSSTILLLSNSAPSNNYSKLNSIRLTEHHNLKIEEQNNQIYLVYDLIYDLHSDGRTYSRGYIRRPVIWICLIYRYRIHRARAFEIAFVVMRDFPTLIHAKPLFLLMYSCGGEVRDKQTVRYLNL